MKKPICNKLGANYIDSAKEMLSVDVFCSDSHFSSEGQLFTSPPEPKLGASRSITGNLHKHPKTIDKINHAYAACEQTAIPDSFMLQQAGDGPQQNGDLQVYNRYPKRS